MLSKNAVANWRLGRKLLAAIGIDAEALDSAVAAKVTPRALELWREVRLHVLPAGWRCAEERNDGCLYARSHGALRGVIVIVSVSEEEGQVWLHVSASKANAMPSYNDLCAIKDLFVGAERKAIEIHAPRSKHVNINPHVRHLWCRLDGDALPEFSVAGSI